MQITSIFDVLVVYTDNVATSASSKKTRNNDPFSLAKNHEHYALAYAYFLKKCSNIGLKAAFTTSGDIVGPGKCKTYWIFKSRKWHKKNEFGFAPIIFDKFSPLRPSLKLKRALLFSGNSSVPFNDPELLSLFNDKLKTFKKLKSHSIPTVKITEKTIEYSILKLKKLVFNQKTQNDFTEDFVLKDRFGSAGIDIFMIKKNPAEEILKIIKSLPKTNFILQPFAKFDKGFTHNKNTGFADIRIIYSNGKIIQKYVRTAKENDFRCNEHQGGDVSYLNTRSVPLSVKLISDKIFKKLNKKNALFALDFLISNNGNAYFVEGNINPGIYWGKKSFEDKTNTKKLIREIVAELFLRARYKKPELLQIEESYSRPILNDNIRIAI